MRPGSGRPIVSITVPARSIQTSSCGATTTGGMNMSVPSRETLGYPPSETTRS